MSKEGKKDDELSYSGCYGSIVAYGDLTDFLETCFTMNRMAESHNDSRYAACIWGHPGVGKTQMVKAFRDRPVEWNGKMYPGYNISNVPVAQFEEMGDLHGIPMDCVLMRQQNKKTDGYITQWVAQKDQILQAYLSNGWEIDTSVPPTTQYAPPAWVPQQPGPSIVLLDDWNRASIRIVKGMMQLLQDYGMVSWQLPAGCNIVLTGNPDEQSYQVTSVDSAILTRIKHVTLKEDMTEWAVWAESNGLDFRGISYALRYPEMITGPGRNRTNPRTLSEFCRFLKSISDVGSESERVIRYANSLLDENTVSSMVVFFQRDMEMILDPMDILNGEEKAFRFIDELMKRKEPRIDILSVIADRLYARIRQSDCKPEKTRITNFQKFLEMDCVPEDTRHALCRRLVKCDDQNAKTWIIGSKKLKQQILSTLIGQ